MKTREVVIAGNWKMYKTIEEAQSFIYELMAMGTNPTSSIYIAVPFTALSAASTAAKGSSIRVGAQNMHDATEGAYTGEISGKMLLDAGAQFVILGHSERRHLFGETNEFINRKVKAALKLGIRPILCIGETLQEREENKTENVLQNQLESCLSGISENELRKILIAYEPVWAIGTGRTASSEQAEEMHRFCRGLLSSKWGGEAAESISILYGGSVKPENTRALMEQKNIDGVLVGGASLTVDSFNKIINYQPINRY
jgi:triosephosphate isomerase